MIRILLLSGYSRSGKNTVGAWLEAEYGAKQFAFADALKRYVSEESGIPCELTQTQEGKETWLEEHGMTVRELLIKRGQEIRAEQNHPGFFAEIVANQIKSHMYIHATQKLYVITDWRLPEELVTLQTEFMRYSNVNVMKLLIERIGQIQSPVNHWTETALLGVPMDIILWNPGTEDELDEELREFAKHIKL